MPEPLTVRLDDLADIPFSANGQPAAHSWQPDSLIRRAANPPEPPTIGGLLYPGKRTVLSGETESMKTWLALILAKAEMELGLPVGWVDLDAMGPGAMLERLQLLGVGDDTIDELFLYFEPADPLNPATLDEVTATIQQQHIRLFVIDAFNPILTLHGLEIEKTAAIETFWRTIADPVCRAGAAPVLLDHVVKNADNRGKYSIGAERKASGAIVHIGFRLLEPLTKGGKGRTLLTVHKDRPGYLPRPTLGRLILDATGTDITYTLEPDKGHDDTGGFRPTIYMEKVSKKLEGQDEPMAKKWIEENEGKAEYVRSAVQHLVEDGYLTETKGPRGALLYTSIRPFRESDSTPVATSSRPRPDLVPNLASVPSFDLVPTPPLGGRGRGQRDRPPTTSSAPRPRPEDEPIPEYDFPPIDPTLEPDPDDLDPGQ